MGGTSNVTVEHSVCLKCGIINGASKHHLRPGTFSLLLSHSLQSSQWELEQGMERFWLCFTFYCVGRQVCSPGNERNAKDLMAKLCSTWYRESDRCIMDISLVLLRLFIENPNWFHSFKLTLSPDPFNSHSETTISIFSPIEGCVNSNSPPEKGENWMRKKKMFSCERHEVWCW